MGGLVLVVGPSGAGKDTLIAAAQKQFAGDPRFVFPRRLVTRAAVAALEDHDTISWDEFRDGRDMFPLSWEAHGLGYALPTGISDEIAGSRTVIANVSRRVIAEALEKFPTHVVLITADPAVRAARLSGRGRETAADVAARLAREGAPLPEDVVAATIDNSGELDVAVSTFCGLLRAL